MFELRRRGAAGAASLQNKVYGAGTQAFSGQMTGVPLTPHWQVMQHCEPSGNVVHTGQEW
jgi:hypothetical protein